MCEARGVRRKRMRVSERALVDSGWTRVEKFYKEGLRPLVRYEKEGWFVRQGHLGAYELCAKVDPRRRNPLAILKDMEELGIRVSNPPM
jgi:hypothetical protein